MVNFINSIPQGLLYPIIFVIVLGVCFLGAFVFRKLKVKDTDVQGMKLALDVFNYVNNQFDYKNKDKVEIVTKYVVESIDIIDSFYKSATIEEKKELINKETLKLLQFNKIDVDEDMVMLVDKVINYLVANINVE